jgi:hypothetical protein
MGVGTVFLLFHRTGYRHGLSFPKVPISRYIVNGMKVNANKLGHLLLEVRLFGRDD